jgi:Peptidase family C25/Propeptide_C25/FlgD Ig-like domain
MFDPHHFPFMRFSPKSLLINSTTFLFLVTFFTANCLFAGQPEFLDSRLLKLTNDFPDAEAHWTVLSADNQSIRLEMRLSSLRVTEFDATGKIWQELSIDRGGLAGKKGAPGLPTTGRLVSVPGGVPVSVRIINHETRKFQVVNLMPVQPEAADDFILDQKAYSQTGWHTVQPAPGLEILTAETSFQTSEAATAPSVFLSSPAMVAGQAVVPLTLGPVTYDPVTGEALITSRVEIEISFHLDKNGQGLVSPISSREKPGPAFQSLLQGQILGSHDKSQNLLEDYDPGTWVVVYDDPLLRPHLLPLVDWRARQGYRVVELIAGDSSAQVIKDQLQAVYDDTSLPALEFILLIGDASGTVSLPTWFESISGYNGEGDHNYTLLDGDDILADAHIGRLSVSDRPMLGTIANKIVNYEQNPPMDNVDWFRKACVIGDPSDSGISTIYVNQWLKGQLLANNYAEVDTIWDGNFTTQMMVSVNSGVSALGYRGYYGMSGISPAHIGALTNGGRLPVAILPTCDTGSFADLISCHSEAFLRAPSGGAIAAIATATPGTHTRYNNCYYHGVWDGLLNAGDSRIGCAHTLGKLELYNNYFMTEPESAEIWANWNNIMGDGASQVWHGVPQSLTVDHPTQVSVGSGALEITVESEGYPIADALVCLYREGEFRITARTNISGVALLATEPLTAGSLQVTVTGQGLLPYMSGLQVGAVDVFCASTGILIDDDSVSPSHGNGDGLLNPGETVEISLAVINQGTTTAFAVGGILTGGDPWSTVGSPDLNFGEIPAGGTAWSDDAALVSISPEAPDGAIISWPLQVSDGNETWLSVVQAQVHAAAFSVSNFDWSGGVSFEPGQSGQLVMDLFNGGSILAGACNATLTSDSPWLQINQAPSFFGDIGVGLSESNTLDPFQIDINNSCIPGHLAALELAVDYNNGMQASVEFAITVGSAETNDPTGPDAYGYYAFDNTDTESFFAPVYEWLAIDPDHGGAGVDVGLEDFGWEQDDTKTVNLPFTFRYYGTDFDQISICSNGWLAMGETPLVHYRNYSIPSKGSPGSMIAPFWDNLNQIDNNRVYSYYDEAGHRFIVQWCQMPNHFSGATQNFEVILLDPAWHPTATGDGAIIFQYDTVSNTDSRDGFATVGIQNHDRTDGLLYSYWNQYPSGATPLQSGLAIRFEPLGEIQLPVPEISPESFAQTLKPGDSSEHVLHIGNSGPVGSFLHFKLEKADPATLPKGQDKSIQGSTMEFSSVSFEPGTTMDIAAIINAITNNGIMTSASIQFPPGVTLNSSGNFSVGPSERLFWQGETGDGILSNWDGLNNGFIYYLENGQIASTTMNVTFSADLTQDLEFNYSLADVGYFTPPDRVNGVIVLHNELPSVRVIVPNSETVAVIGETLVVEFALMNVSGIVDIALQRQPEGPWEPLATNVDGNSGTWDWMATGEPGPHAVIRVSDSQDQSIFHESEVFVVGRNLDWVQLQQSEGTVAAGQTGDFTLNLDATGLDNGLYPAVLLLTTNSGDTFTIPINLTVESVSGTGETQPRTVALLGNHPNPFNPSTTVSFSLPGEMPVTVDIFSARGMRVRRLLNGRQAAGVHHIVWDGTDKNGRNAPSGVYFCRLVTPETTVTEKIVLAK